MIAKYNDIITNLKAARSAGDEKQIKSWKRKLSNWQKAYGAYAPITQTTFNKYE